MHSSEIRPKMNTSEGPRKNLKPFNEGYYRAMKYNHTNDKFTGYSQTGAASRFIRSKRKVIAPTIDKDPYFDTPYTAPIRTHSVGSDI